MSVSARTFSERSNKIFRIFRKSKWGIRKVRNGLVYSDLKKSKLFQDNKWFLFKRQMSTVNDPKGQQSWLSIMSHTWFTIKCPSTNTQRHLTSFSAFLSTFPSSSPYLLVKNGHCTGYHLIRATGSVCKWSLTFTFRRKKTVTHRSCIVCERCFHFILTTLPSNQGWWQNYYSCLPCPSSAVLLLFYIVSFVDKRLCFRLMILSSCSHMRQVRCWLPEKTSWISTDLLYMGFQVGGCKGFVSHHPILSLHWYNTGCKRCFAIVDPELKTN